MLSLPSSYDLGCVANVMSMWMTMLGLCLGYAIDNVMMINDPYLGTHMLKCE